MNRKELKSNARACLKGKWGTAILACVIFSLLIGGSGGTAATSSGVDYSNIHIDTGLAAAVFSIGFLVILGIVIVLSIVFSPVMLGYTSFNLRLSNGESPTVGELFSLYKNNILRSFLFIVLKNVLVLLWSLLFLVPGIVAHYRYAMAEYIMVQNPNISGREAIARSKEMMKGHKGELFVLRLSFLGWALLSVFTLGIGLLWLVPYMNQTETQFFRRLSAEA